MSKDLPYGLARKRRRIYSCEHCDEVFVDPESLQRHVEQHLFWPRKLAALALLLLALAGFGLLGEASWRESQRTPEERRLSEAASRVLNRVAGHSRSSLDLSVRGCRLEATVCLDEADPTEMARVRRLLAGLLCVDERRGDHLTVLSLRGHDWLCREADQGSLGLFLGLFGLGAAAWTLRLRRLPDPPPRLRRPARLAAGVLVLGLPLWAVGWHYALLPGMGWWSAALALCGALGRPWRHPWHHGAWLLLLPLVTCLGAETRGLCAAETWRQGPTGQWTGRCLAVDSDCEVPPPAVGLPFRGEGISLWPLAVAALLGVGGLRRKRRATVAAAPPVLEATPALALDVPALGPLRPAVEAVRLRLSGELGVPLPEVRLLERPGDLVIRVWGHEVVRHEMGGRDQVWWQDRWCARGDEGLSPLGVVQMLLAGVFRQKAGSLLGLEEARALLGSMPPRLVAAARVDAMDWWMLLRRLLGEGIPVADRTRILEAVAMPGAVTLEARLDRVRLALWESAVGPEPPFDSRHLLRQNVYPS